MKEEQKKKRVQKKKEKVPFHTAEVVLLLVLACFISIPMGMILQKRIDKKSNSLENSELFQNFLDNYEYIKENYKEDATEEELLEGAISGMLEVVGDPYAGIIELDSRLDQELNGSIYGIGIEIINNEDGNIQIYSVFQDSPAKKAGLEEGDIVLSADETDFIGKETKEFSNYISKKEGAFKVKIQRGEETKEVTLEKGYVVIPSVFSETFERNGKKIGFLEVTIFSATTYNQFKTALEKLEKEKIDSLIIDVRSNTGGRLDAVSNMISLFLDSSHIIYQTDTKGEKKEFYSAGTVTKTYPIVVLIDGISASASEVLASALSQEYGATLIGTKSYGKGTVQEVKTLLNGDEYKVTTKKWLTPNGTCIDQEGLTPDIEVELNEEYKTNPSHETDTQLQSALDYLSK